MKLLIKVIKLLFGKKYIVYKESTYPSLYSVSVRYGILPYMFVDCYKSLDEAKDGITKRKNPQYNKKIILYEEQS